MGCSKIALSTGLPFGPCWSGGGDLTSLAVDGDKSSPDLRVL